VSLLIDQPSPLLELRDGSLQNRCTINAGVAGIVQHGLSSSSPASPTTAAPLSPAAEFILPRVLLRHR